MARLRLLIPVTAVTFLLLVVRAGVLGSFAGEVPAAALRELGPAGRATTFLAVIPEYTRLLIWPLHLQAEYGPPGIPVGGPIGARHLLGALLLSGLVALFLFWRRRRPVAAFGLWWFAVTLAPVSNLLTATGMVMAERVLFVPSIGLAIALGAALQQGRETRKERRLSRAPAGEETRWYRAALPATLVTWGVILAARSATRVPTWSTQRRFFTDLTIDAPAAYRAWKGAGEYWEGTGDHPRAIADLQHAIDLWPHDAEVNERLGQFLRADGQCDAAVPVLAAGVRLDPDATSIRAKLIECLLMASQWDQAEQYANDALTRGETEFESVRLRIDRLRMRATAGNGSPP